MHKVKKLICTLLAVCIISTTLAQPVQAFTGAEGAILGGGAGLASISLTAPQVALLVAAGFGIVVAVENADKLAEGMTAALNTAAAGVDAGAETLAQWLETAKKGSIAIASAPAWIAAAIKSWIGSLYDVQSSSNAWAPVQSVSAGQTVSRVPDMWSVRTLVYDTDVTRVFYGYANPNSNGTYSCYAYSLVFSTSPWSYDEYYLGSHSESGKYQNKLTLDGTTYYYREATWGSTVNSNSSSQYELDAISCCSTLPHPNTIPELNAGGRRYNIIRACATGVLSPSAGPICPDAKVGGIGSVLEQGKSIDDVNMPDLDVAGSKSICPDGVLDGSIPIADTVADVIVGLTDGTLSWSDYVSDVAVGTPSISVPVEGTETGVVDYPITDTGVSDVPIEETPDHPGEVDVPEGLAPYTVQLKDFFPFCIPFDIVDFVGVLCADPVAPSFEWTFTQYSGQKDTLEIDLAPFDEVAQLLRNMELLLFIIGLAFLTRNLIRG